MIPKRRTAILPALLLICVGNSEAETWLETRAAIEEFADASDYDAAIGLGEELLVGVAEAFGASSNRLAETHLMLADLHIESGDPFEAQRQIILAIEILQRNEGEYSTLLIEPYTSLGETQFLAREYELSIEAFDRGRDIGRRVYGLLNQQQLPLMDRMIRSAMASGDFDRAKDIREDQANIVRRFHGQESLQYLEESIRFANWLRARGAFSDSQHEFNDIQDIIDELFDADPKLTIQRLRLRSAYWPYLYASPALARPKDLRQALKIVEELEQPDPELHATVLLELGDWYLLAGRNGNDFERYYKAAWKLLADAEHGEQLLSDWFSSLSVVSAGRFNSLHFTEDPMAPEGFVTVAFTVDIFGRAIDTRVVDADPIGLVDDAAISQIANSLFRPALVDGELTPSTSTFTWRFRYTPTEDLETAAVTDTAGN